MKGLDFFSSVNDTSQKDELIELEKKFQVKFPPLYFSFHATFNLGDNGLDLGNFLNPKWKDLSSSGIITYPQDKVDREVWVNEFYDAADIEKLMDNDVGDEVLQENGLIRIGSIGIGGGLCLGLRGELREKICITVWDDDEPFVVLSNNIYDFISKLEFIEDDSNLPDGSEHSNFLKKWGEDFWRLDLPNSLSV